MAVESVIALAAVAPLSRRAARQRTTIDAPIPEAPVVPLIDASDDVAVVSDADVSIVTDKVEELIEISEPVEAIEHEPAAEQNEEPTTAVQDEEPEAAAEPAEESLPHADADAFDRASRAFRATGPVPAASASEEPVAEPAPAAEPAAAGGHVPPRRPRNVRKILTAGATVGVMSLAGLLAVSMTLPAEAVAAVQGSPLAATSLVTASEAAKAGTADDEIQAFVAPAGVESESLARADDFSTVSLVQVAAEQGINYSSEIFTNDPDAAIQWPFLVGVGMSYGYGMRSGRLHEGIDFVPGNGAPVQAIADGTVRIATEQGGAYGVTVYIDHVIDGSVITSHYSHMQYGSLQVKAGDTVKVGDMVGKTGNTGRSYGAHMHFELIVNGSTIDPLPWLRENAGRYEY
ncbi:M23 family metallopeptidase [Microbacterium sp. W4I20]|uniref:M23 family metallopeptidase n=1 Tax=Microbacterium sp. W4I20 TaxID=3042262 RepID=UPI00277F5AA8|nr:M23 family metallopeptidase [Microbacterium sp. W4I20]MDQ0726356.1 murein DD-endopeptidase MepM/ murein hydrolase activator NlpD [Microbacterium sp. W4I20]